MLFYFIFQTGRAACTKPQSEIYVRARLDELYPVGPGQSMYLKKSNFPYPCYLPPYCGKKTTWTSM